MSWRVLAIGERVVGGDVFAVRLSGFGRPTLKRGDMLDRLRPAQPAEKPIAGMAVCFARAATRRSRPTRGSWPDTGRSWAGAALRMCGRCKPHHRCTLGDPTLRHNGAFAFAS
jgi:hypothetical protein